MKASKERGPSVECACPSDIAGASPVKRKDWSVQDMTTNATITKTSISDVIMQRHHPRGIFIVVVSATFVGFVAGMFATVLYLEREAGFWSSSSSLSASASNYSSSMEWWDLSFGSVKREWKTQELRDEGKGENVRAEKQRSGAEMMCDDALPNIFNCNSCSGLCTYYHPARFFGPDGEGRDFTHFLMAAEEKRRNGTLWQNMPSVGFSTLALDETTHLPPERRVPFPKQNLTLIHVHKTGGTSIRKACTMLRRSFGAKMTYHKWFSQRHNHPPLNGKAPAAIMGSARYSHGIRGSRGRFPPPGNITAVIEGARETLTHAVTYPSDGRFGQEDHMLYAVLRDPTERFISSIGQAMGASGSKRNGVGPEFQRACLHNTTQETLRCCVNYVRTHSTWFELHFAPQALDISFATMWMDVPVAIFPFRDVPKIMEDLGFPPTMKMRDGSERSYRPDPILTNLSVADYDDDLLRDVCGIYEVDVILQRSLGMEVPRCDPFIPR